MEGNIVFTGGGTGGHVFPGLAVIEALPPAQRREVVWLGSSHGPERKIAERQGIRFVGIPAGKLRRYLSWRNLVDVVVVAAALVKSVFVLIRLRPAVLFSKGGYVSVPPVIAARLLRVPSITHESDYDPGLATRLNAPFVDSICIPYEESRERFSSRWQAKLFVTGNPVRRAVLAGDAARGRERFGIPADIPVLLFLGGSQGALQINELVRDMLPELVKRYAVIHQRGHHPIPQAEGERYKSAEFYHDEYADAVAAADLVVCRAGAGTLWELAALGKPAILIPLGSGSSRGDQERNAEIYAASGAAWVLSGAEACAETLRSRIDALLADRGRLDLMTRQAQVFGARDAADRIASMIQSHVQEKAHGV
jgi:UDP-N-acetylglucosamine--N-acetylmuramyl-(pentapeptide) pyrophosphoryl-undecaprenol N-acetylglucosamine transferase